MLRLPQLGCLRPTIGLKEDDTQSGDRRQQHQGHTLWGIAARTAKMSPPPRDAFADVDVFVDEVVIKLPAMARNDIRSKPAVRKQHQDKVDPKRLVFIDETWMKTNMTRTHGALCALYSDSGIGVDVSRWAPHSGDEPLHEARFLCLLRCPGRFQVAEPDDARHYSLPLAEGA